MKVMIDFVKDNFGRLDYAFDNAGRKWVGYTTMALIVQDIKHR